MTAQFINLLLVLLFPLALLVLMMAARRANRIRRALEKSRPADQCRCGYLLKNLSVPRCPECGCVLGFNATSEELGLTREELERIHTARERRKRNGAS